MRRITIYGFILLAAMSFQAKGQQKGFELSGHLDGLVDGKPVYLSFDGDYESDIKDSCIVRNGNFSFKSTSTDGPRPYVLQLTPMPTPRYASLILSNNETVTITCDSSIQKIMHSNMGGFLTFHNGRCQAEAQRLLSASLMYSQALSAVRISINKVKDSIGFNPHLMAMFLAQRAQLSISFYGFLSDEAIHQPILPLVVVGTNLHQDDHHSSLVVPLYNRLSENTKNTYYGRLLKEYVALAVGQPFPPFTLPTDNGNQLSCNEIFPKNKLTIVHFWTSNSIDKEIYQNELKFLYKKYHEKGLNVIGVYAGKYMEAWRDELKNGNYPWYNVADLKGKEGPCQRIYREPGNPNNRVPLEPNNTTNVLVDSSGNIVAWDARDVELQYYLWKTFDQ